MKNLFKASPSTTLLGTLALSFVIGSVMMTQSTVAQNGGSNQVKPSAVGLIDMAYVFKEYDKFKAMREGMAEEMKSVDSNIRGKAEEMKRIAEQLQSGNFAEGSAEYKQLESQLISMNTGLETQRKVQQREFMRKESEIYKSIYVEVQGVVKKYADVYGYDVIVRFNRNAVGEAGNPQEVLQNMNRQVVHFNRQNDITDTIVKYMNDKYKKSGGMAPTR